MLKMFKKLLLLFLGTASWSAALVKSGWIYPFGMGFWGANGHDGIWHIALAESLSKGSSQMPVFAGAPLQNYHIGFDLLLAFLNKITTIPIVNLYFQILPPISAFLIGFLVYEFVMTWTKSEKSALLSTFFIYFGGSLAWIIGKGESTFWATQAISTLINPPFTLSLILVLSGMIALLKKKKILAILCFGILVQIKIYAGLLVLGALLIAGIWDVFVGTLAISLLLYLPFNRSSTNLVVFKPFWFLETMMGFSDKVGWARFGEAMVNYKAGGVWLKAVLAYGAAFVIFIIGNFGTRLTFLFKKVKLDSMNKFIYAIVAAGIIVPMFFLQKGTAWNTIQFMYYSLFFSAILAGITLSKINGYLLIAIILFTIPTTVITLKDVYLPSRPPAKLSNEELEALKFLSTQPDGVVLTYPFDENAARQAESFPPRPLYLYTSTAYVSAFGKHPTYLADEINLDITGYDWQSRSKGVEAWYKEKDQEVARKFLEKNNIKYVYWLKGQRALLGETQLGLINIFENSLVAAYRVD